MRSYAFATKSNVQQANDSRPIAGVLRQLPWKHRRLHCNVNGACRCSRPFLGTASRRGPLWLRVAASAPDDCASVAGVNEFSACAWVCQSPPAAQKAAWVLTGGAATRERPPRPGLHPRGPEPRVLRRANGNRGGQLERRSGAVSSPWRALRRRLDAILDGHRVQMRIIRVSRAVQRHRSFLEQLLEVPSVPTSSETRFLSKSV